MSEVLKSEVINPETMGTYMGYLMTSISDLSRAYQVIQSNIATPIISDYESGGNAGIYYGEAIEELAVFANSLGKNVERLINLIYFLYEYMAKIVEDAQLTDVEMTRLIEVNTSIITVETKME